MTQSQKKGLFYGWIIVMTAFTVIFLHLSIRGSFAVFLKPMGKDLGWSTAKVSIGLSLFMLCYGVTAFFAGRSVDKFGPRRVMFLHGVLMGLGLILSSYSVEPWQFYLTYGIMGGIGAGALFVPPTVMVRKWFIKDMGKALGFAVSGAGLGFFVAPIASMYLIEIVSWQFAMKVFGLIIMLGVALATVFMRGKPEDMGLKPFGYEEAKLETHGKTKAASTAEVFWSLKEALHTPAFWTIAIMWFCSNFAEYIVFSHSVNYVVTDRGFDLKTATYIFSLVGLCFLICGPLGGSIADKLGTKYNDEFKGRKVVITSCYIIACLASAWLSHVKTPGMYLVYALIFGIPFGTYIPSVAAYVGTTFGAKSMGAIWGLTTALGVAGGAGLGPYVGGYLRDITGNYQASIWLACAVYALTAILCFAVKKPCKVPVESSKMEEKAVPVE